MVSKTNLAFLTLASPIDFWALKTAPTFQKMENFAHLLVQAGGISARLTTLTLLP